MRYDEHPDDLSIDAQIGSNLKKAFPVCKEDSLTERMENLLDALHAKAADSGEQKQQTR